MDIQTRKIEFVQEFLKLQNEETVSLFESLLKLEVKQHFEPMSLNELNNRIHQSEEDFEKGNFNSHKDVFAKYNQ